MQVPVEFKKPLQPILLAALMFFYSWTGCGDTPTETSEQSTNINIEALIIRPKAPAPGDSVFLTAIVTGSSSRAGEIPTLTWRVNNAVLDVPDNAHVVWIVPDTSKIYEISITAATSSSTAQRTKKIFATNNIALISQDAGEIWVAPGDTSFYYLKSSIVPDDIAFSGFSLWMYSAGNSISLSDAHPGLDYEFASDVSFAVHSAEMNNKTATSNPVNLFFNELPFGGESQLTHDGAAVFNGRKDRYTNPSISPDGTLIAFQGLNADTKMPDQGAVDTFDIYVKEKASGIRRRITSRGKNFYPSFSSDGAYLAFVSDGGSLLGWEIFAFPVSAGMVDTSAAALVQLTNTGGLITSSLPPGKPKSAWNPNQGTPVLALVGADGKLRMIDTGGADGTVRGISGGIEDLIWYHDGTSLAVSTGSAIYIAGLDRSASLIKSFDKDDMVTDMAWSDDKKFMLYRITRGADSWYEVMDLSGTFGWDSPIAVSNRFRAQNGSIYRSVISIRPRWVTAARVLSPVFEFSTPGIIQMDLSGLYK